MLASHPSRMDPIQPVQQIRITASHSGQRLDNFLFTALRQVPKSRLYRIIRKGEVRVNKRRVCVNYRLVCEDIVRIPPLRCSLDTSRPLMPSKKLVDTINCAICYEDDQLLVINKPAGLAVHGGSGISLGLIEALRSMRPQSTFLELVHRLDRDTSGCIMLAKRRSMLTYLHECLQLGKIEKRYFALVSGRWEQKGVIEAPLLKFVFPSGERRVKVDPKGKCAQTRVRKIGYYHSATLLEATPITGRTHQIRVHCCFKGHPIVGDEKYGDPECNRQARTDQFERLFLHAHQLVIPLPFRTSPLTIECPLPSTCQDYLSKIQKREKEINNYGSTN